MKLKQLTKQITTLALTAAMATTMLLSPANVSAASKKAQKKANKAYAQAIKKNKVAKFTSYSLIEVTGGGTKELITVNENRRPGKINIYTYSKGKVKKIWTTTKQAVVYNKKQKTLVSLEVGAPGYEVYDAYKYNGKKIVKKARYTYKDGAYKVKENGKTKKITKKAYKSATKNDVGIWPSTEATKEEAIQKLSK